jgi:RNA polymerase sigma factor for flagellar operon FliA
MGLEALQNQLCLSLEAVHENFASARSGGSDNEPYRHTLLQEVVDRVADLVDELTPREQLVLSLYYQEELNMREAAEVMGVTEGRVSQLHSQALAKLKSRFSQRYGPDAV